EYQPPYTMGTNEPDTVSDVRIYGDGKFRNTQATGGTTADLTIDPSSNDISQWLDVNISTWETSGTYQKEWTETSTNITGNVPHVVGDLKTDTYYDISVDSVLGQNVTGATCASGICKSDSQGKIAFTYTGTYSTHIFTVTENPDNVAPVRSEASPSGTLSSGTTQTTISLTTNENATCKYDTTSGTAYDSIANTFSTTGTTSHSQLVTGLSDGNTYSYYARCQDDIGNQNSDDYTISFSIDSNNPPTDIILSDSSIDENQAINTVVGTLSTTDSDIGDTHSYSLACATSGTDDGSFNISSDSLRSSEVFDYETKSSYAICIRTSDGTDTYDENFTIIVNEPASSGNSFFVSPPSIGNGLINYYLNIGETKNTGEIGFSGFNYLIYIGSQINFTIANSPTIHSASIINLNMISGDITTEFKSEPIVVIFKIGEEKNVDLDNDGIANIRVKYNELKVNRVDLTITQLTKTGQIFDNNNLVKEFGKPTVYLIENGKKRPIQNEKVFNARGFSWNNIIETDNLSSYQTGEILKEIEIIENSLVKEINSPKIYLIENNKKRWIVNEVAFNNNGFLWSDVIETNNLDNYSNGEIIEGKINIQSLSASSCSALFTYGLNKGAQNDDVKRLQELLSTQADIYPEGLTTGYFGSLTEKAVQRFQLKFGVVKTETDLGFGYVGPKTRDMLKEVFGE
ncbi:hypothetical protein GQ568_00925, partial [Patescibacteria group bacterium]|nr:hypothetical protein [Patescibacteria group bacterium]